MPVKQSTTYLQLLHLPSTSSGGGRVDDDVAILVRKVGILRLGKVGRARCSTLVQCHNQGQWVSQLRRRVNIHGNARGVVTIVGHLHELLLGSERTEDAGEEAQERLGEHA